MSALDLCEELGTPFEAKVQRRQLDQFSIDFVLSQRRNVPQGTLKLEQLASTILPQLIVVFSFHPEA